MAVDSVYIPEEGARAAMDAWMGDTALGPAHAHLTDEAKAWNPALTLADLHEASFTGYAVLNAVWGVAFTNGGGKAQTDSNNLLWTFTGGAGTTPVFAVYLTDAADSILLAYIPLIAPEILTPGSPNFSRVISLTGISEL